MPSVERYVYFFGPGRADGSAAITSISTDNFSADAAGNSNIDAMVSLPQPCIAPIIFVTGPAGVGVWFAVTGG